MPPSDTTPLNPAYFLDRAAKIFSERTGVIDGERRFSYREFGERAHRLAGLLRGAGAQNGDRIAALCTNSHVMLEMHNGVPMAGCALVPMNIRLSSQEMAYILENSGARMLIATHELAEAARTLSFSTGVRLILAGEDSSEYEELLKSSEPCPTAVINEMSLLAINYTSGSTGRPKGVMYTHRGAYLQALAMAFHSRLGLDSSYLWTLPMFHCNGWCFAWAVTAVGGRHVCLPKVDPPVVWRLIAAEGVTHLNGAPAVLVMLGADEAAHPLERPVQVTTAGAPPPPAVISRTEALGFRINHVYGLTETYGPITVCEWQVEWDGAGDEERARLKARQGVAFVTSDPVRVVDAEMRDVPADAETMGEVVMRGNNVMKGYFADEAATAEAFRGGWFHSGDLAVMHPDGYIEIRDRAKDIIISGGENISTIEVEKALVRHPDVLEAAVVAKPDEKWGERPMAFVTLRPDAKLTADELIAFARETLP